MEELNWYKTYSLHLDCTQPNLKEFINKLSNKIDDKNVENKINQIENDYKNKLKEIQDLCSNTIMIDDIKVKSSLYIIQKELDIIQLNLLDLMIPVLMEYSYSNVELLVELEMEFMKMKESLSKFGEAELRFTTFL